MNQKFVALCSLYFECTVLAQNVLETIESKDFRITFKGIELEIEIYCKSFEEARKKADEILLKISAWMSLIYKVFVTAEIKYVENESGKRNVISSFDTLRGIPLTKDKYENGISVLKKNINYVIKIEPKARLALEYITLGIKLMNSNIRYRYRYAILEYARSVEILLGNWKKDLCVKELENRGWDYLINDIKWLLEIRGNLDVAHPPFLKSNMATGKSEATKARDIAINLILEETGFEI